MSAGYNNVMLVGSITSLTVVGAVHLFDLDVEGIQNSVRCMLPRVENDPSVGDVVMVTGSLRPKVGLVVASCVALLDRLEASTGDQSQAPRPPRSPIEEHRVSGHTRRLRDGRVITIAPYSRGGKQKALELG